MKVSDADGMLSQCGNDKAPKKRTVKTQTYFKFNTLQSLKPNTEHKLRPNLKLTGTTPQQHKQVRVYQKPKKYHRNRSGLCPVE